nr:hypothetical protein [Tanacetum cinerariifolium]
MGLCCEGGTSSHVAFCRRALNSSYNTWNFVSGCAVVAGCEELDEFDSEVDEDVERDGDEDEVVKEVV